MQGAVPELFSYYENGQCRNEATERLQADENWSKQGGHQPWREDPAFVASVMTTDLLPPTGQEVPAIYDYRPVDSKLAVSITNGRWAARYVLESTSPTSAFVTLQVNGRSAFALRLERPFGYGWYVTGLRQAGLNTVAWPSLRRKRTWFHCDLL